MRYLALATDYDETCATGGKIALETLSALERLKQSGRKLILVTGRMLDDLKSVCSQFTIFDCLVVENGAVLFWPTTGEENVLCPPVPIDFFERLREKRVSPLSKGRVIVATQEPFQKEALSTIQETGFDLQIIFNKGAVMILPSAVHKAFGLKEALKKMKLPLTNVIGIGDAENDQVFLAECGFSIAVGNAIEPLKQKVDWAGTLENGRCVQAVIKQVVENDLKEFDSKIENHALLLGYDESNQPLLMSPRKNYLITGKSGSGKSTLTMALLEGVIAKGHCFCMIDPEGDYNQLPETLVMGDAKTAPQKDLIVQTLEQTEKNLVVNLLAVPLVERPRFFSELLSAVQLVRSHTGKPYWLFIDEVHHLYPKEKEKKYMFPSMLQEGCVLITAFPDELAESVLKSYQGAIIIGKEKSDIKETLKRLSHKDLEPDFSFRANALLWNKNENTVTLFQSLLPTTERRRHLRKYVEGKLADENCFYFLGPERKTNLKAYNLKVFIELAEGIDDETWFYHLRRNDYSTWFKNHIKDALLAKEALLLEEKAEQMTSQEGKKEVAQLIEKHFMV